MKKQVWIWGVVFAAAVLCTAPVATAQSSDAAADTTIDAVRLKQGGVLKGIITELVPDERLKVLTLGGEKFGVGWGAVDSLWTERVSGDVAEQVASLRGQAMRADTAKQINGSTPQAITHASPNAAGIVQVEESAAVVRSGPATFQIKLGLNAGLSSLGFMGACAFFGVQVNEHALTLRSAGASSGLFGGTSITDVALLYGRTVPVSGDAIHFTYSGGLGYVIQTTSIPKPGGFLFPSYNRFTSYGFGIALQAQLEITAPWIGFNVGMAGNFGPYSFINLMIGFQFGKLWP